MTVDVQHRRIQLEVYRGHAAECAPRRAAGESRRATSGVESALQNEVFLYNIL